MRSGYYFFWISFYLSEQILDFWFCIGGWLLVCYYYRYCSLYLLLVYLFFIIVVVVPKISVTRNTDRIRRFFVVVKVVVRPIKFYAEITKQNIFPPYTPKNNTSSVTEQQQNISHNQKQNINKIKNPTMVRINNNSPIIHNNKSSPSKNNIQNICKNPINNTNLRNYTNLLRTENTNLKDDKKRTDPNLISKINSLIEFPEIKINLPITETKYIWIN